MIHTIRIERHPNEFPPEKQFAWTLGSFAVNAQLEQVPEAAREMVMCRIIDTFGVALHAINHQAVVAARHIYAGHEGIGRSCMLGMSHLLVFPAEAAAFVNSVAGRDDDWHDCFLAAEYSHPADTIPALVAKAQEIGASGEDLMLAIAVAYEVQCQFVQTICLHENKMDHGTWICLGILAGLASLCKLTEKQAYDSICIGLHQAWSTRGGRRGDMSPHKAFHPAYMSQIALQANALASIGISGPNPIFEGVDGPFARMMKFRVDPELAKIITRCEAEAKQNGSHPEINSWLTRPASIDALNQLREALWDEHYEIELPGPGDAIKKILDTWTKEHPTEYQSQAVIDGGWALHEKLKDQGGWEEVANVVYHTSHHTHYVIGDGEGTPEKKAPLDGAPVPSRETLDHCAPATGAIAIVYGRPENGRWEVEHYDRAADPKVQEIWRRFRTEEDPEYTRRYLAGEAFGGKFIVKLKNGQTVEHVQDVACAHPQHESGGFTTNGYVSKFERTTENAVNESAVQTFIGHVFTLERLSAGQLSRIHLPCSGELMTATSE